MPHGLPATLEDDLLRVVAPAVERWLDDVQNALRDTESQYQVDWRGSAREVGLRVIRDTVWRDLLKVLGAIDRLDATPAQRDEIAQLQARILECVPAEQSPHQSAVEGFQRRVVAIATSEHLALDSRFVRLTVLRDQGPGIQGERFVEEQQPRLYTDLRDMLAQEADPCIVLLGDPGGGKTTLLRRLQYDHALDGLQARTNKLAYFVPLSAYPLDATSPREWLAKRWGDEWRDLPGFEALLQQGRLLLLLDALNELKRKDNDDLTRRIEQWSDFLPGFAKQRNRAVITCRSLDYSQPLSNQDIGVVQANVKPMTSAQIHEFFGLYLPDGGEQAWKQIEADAELLKLYETPYFLKLLVDVLATSPDKRLPENRAALFTRFVRATLRRELNNKHPLLTAGELLKPDDRTQIANDKYGALQLPNRGKLIPALEALAHTMQRAGLRGERAQVRVDKPEALQHLRATSLSEAQAEDVIATGVALNMLELRIDENDAVLFKHQLLQEFFAARAFARKPEFGLAASVWRADAIRPTLKETLAKLADYEPLPPPPASGWEETVRMAAALAVPAGNADEFIESLARENLPLAATAAAAPGVSITPNCKHALQTALLARMHDPAADLRARIAAGLALGTLGDHRFAEGRGPGGARYLEPLMVNVPAGTYPIGDNKGQYEDERPAHTVKLAAFAIGKFAVTNAEYRCFVDSGGYEDERWWQTRADKAWRDGSSTSEGRKKSWRADRETLQGWTEEYIHNIPNWTSKEKDEYLNIRNQSDADFEDWLEESFPEGVRNTKPGFWGDARFDNPSQPVVGICWHEARAYCAWLSAQTGRACRLPSEVEFEAATRGPKSRAFAYGPDFDAAKCNTFESHVRRTTPVGLFVTGETELGIADLSGNAWCWTSSAYLEYPHEPTPEREDPAHNAERCTLRGGSWDGDRGLARAVARFGNLPLNRGSNVGFRVVCAPV